MAGRQTVKEKAEALALPVAEGLGLSLWETEYVKEGASYFLRFYIDKPDGVLLDDCEAFSRAIDPLLDEEDFIDDAYYLEVSAPGIERKLSKAQHFAFCMGSTIRVRLIRPIDGVKEFTGVLKAFADDVITIEALNEDKQIDFKACAWVKLCDLFEIEE